jgi:hypothetical protein
LLFTEAIRKFLTVVPSNAPHATTATCSGSRPKRPVRGRCSVSPTPRWVLWSTGAPPIILASTPYPRDSADFKALIARRTGCERSNSLKKVTYRLGERPCRSATHFLVRLYLVSLLEHA